ncbi:C1 family peptidase [Nibricoccus aquaticus]|nr:C1 family peptidase [Nibricoccus aquaticus]
MLRPSLALRSLCLLLTLPTLFAQQPEPAAEPGTGLIFDLPSYRGTPYKATLTAESYASAPRKASLEQYCPTPGNQGQYGTCVAFAVAYHARTVLYGAQHGITDKTQLNASVFSPTFIYEQIKEAGDASCQKGTNPINALELMKTSGIARIATVPYQCGAPITSNALLEAVDYTINDYQILFMPDVTDYDTRVNTVRKSLAEGYPVVHCFTVVKSFYKAPRIWRSLPTDGGAEGQHGRHAMLIVGYDDDLDGGCFRVLNSWGPTWADGGYVWIPYTEFVKYSLGAIQVYGPRGSSGHQPAPGVTPGKSAIKTADYQLSGRLNFRLRDGTAMNAHRIVSNDSTLSAYKMDQSYSSGTRFRFFVTTNTEAYIYAFATDTTGKVNKILPFEDGMSPLVGPNSTIAFPSEKKVVRMDEQKGTDYLLVLYTDRPLNVKQVHEKLNAASGPLLSRLRSALGTRIVDPAVVKYSANDIAFDVERVAPGGIVPLMVEITHD